MLAPKKRLGARPLIASKLSRNCMTTNMSRCSLSRIHGITAFIRNFPPPARPASRCWLLRRALDPIGGVNGPERLPRRVHQRVDRDALAAGTADRLLQQLRVECDQVVDALPLEPFDVTVDLIVTPTRTIEVPTRSTA